MSDEGQTDLAGMGMGVLRWLLGSRRAKDDEEDEREKAEEWKKGKRARGSSRGYRFEVGGESGAMRGDGPPFSFWGSARIILILSFLLWWVQPAGPMIAGYVGGRRSGSPMKGVLAALLPVVIILIANVAYARDVGTHQIDFVSSLPDAVAGGAASLLPFLLPYKEFLVGYMSGFVQALQNTFGMGTNGYLMVIIFAYIGGLIAEQTRRELYFKNGASQTVGLNLIQPLFGGRHPAAAEDAYEEDEELQEFRRPVRARARGHGQPVVGVEPHRRRRHGRPDRFEDYRKVNGDPYEDERRRVHARGRDEEDLEAEEDEEAMSSRSRRAAHASPRDHRAHARASEEEEEDEETEARPDAHESRRARQRSHEEEVAIQRFVERALKHYEHPTR